MSVDGSFDSQSSTRASTPKRDPTKSMKSPVSDCSIKSLPGKPSELSAQMSLDTSDGKESDDAIQFMDSPFAQSLIPHIHLIGVTSNSIESLCPSQSTASW